jgi:hypothetical protein
MFHAALFIAIVLAAVGMGLSLAHALELPGKRRLGRDAYFAVQTIYYPGFTIGGAFGEPLAIVACLVTALFTTPLSPLFWLILAALVCLLFEHALYWLLTHPVNKVWLQEQSLRGAGAAFFASGGPSPSVQSWTTLRDRWEFSHVARAAFAGLAFVFLLIVAVRPG